MSKSLFEHNRSKLGCNAKMKKIEPELISDPDMYMLFEKDTRGEISYICNIYSKGSNNYLKPDAKQESKHIIYLDVNNLSDYAMSKFFSNGSILKSLT